jgi:arginase
MSPSPPVSSGVRPRIAVVGAASSIGIRPYDDGRARHLDHAPAALRELGLGERLRAEDLGDVTPPPYRDFIRPPGRVRNEEDLGSYSRAVADRIGHAAERGNFVLVLGGDCSIILGSLLGVVPHVGPVGLAYIDAHADFASADESRTGSAASMCLALAVGRGDSPLARLAGDVPLVRAADVVLIGRRDAGQSYGHDALSSSGVLDIPGDVLARDGARAVAARAVERLERAALGGFWIHVDADVLDPRRMPAVDSPEPGGPDIDDLAALLVPMVRHPGALGLQLTIYDPALDVDRSCGRRLVALLETVLADDVAANHDAVDAGGEA